MDTTKKPTIKKDKLNMAWYVLAYFIVALAILYATVQILQDPFLVFIISVALVSIGIPAAYLIGLRQGQRDMKESIDIGASLVTNATGASSSVDAQMAKGLATIFRESQKAAIQEANRREQYMLTPPQGGGESNDTPPTFEIPKVEGIEEGEYYDI